MASRSNSSDESEENVIEVQMDDDDSGSDIYSENDDGSDIDEDLSEDAQMQSEAPSSDDRDMENADGIEQKSVHHKSVHEKSDIDSGDEMDKTIYSIYEVVDALSTINKPATIGNIMQYLLSNAIYPQTESEIQNALSSGLEEGVLKMHNDKYSLLDRFDTKPVQTKKTTTRQSRAKTREPQ